MNNFLRKLRVIVSGGYTMRRYLIFSILLVFLSGFPSIHADEACDGYDPHSYLKSNYSASSYLGDKKNPDRYAPLMAFDGNLETAWVEGKKGDGVGEKLAFYLSGSPVKIRIMPGFGIEKYFKMNNRIKSATLTIYAVKAVLAHQCGEDYGIGDIVSQKTLNFKDSMTMQEFETGLSGREHLTIYDKGLLGELEIKSVYRGTKWRDTCIAEIILVQGRSGSAK
jgi:hypothetical protein